MRVVLLYIVYYYGLRCISKAFMVAVLGVERNGSRVERKGYCIDGRSSSIYRKRIALCNYRTAAYKKQTEEK